MKRKNIILTAVLILLQLCSSLWALPTTAYEAEMAVAGWLKVDPQPLDTALGQQVIGAETFTDDLGEPVYYIVYLEPSGFVIVSADDLVEPIIGFADDGTYDPSPENPLGALVTNDLNGRMAAIHSTFRLQAIVGEASFTDTQRKWSFFISLAESSEDGFSLMGRSSIPDVRVAPLVRSKWGQQQACDRDTYNYYTPNNYRSGCVATAMAQMMRYYQHPTVGIGVHQFTIEVDDVERTASTRGGNGNGGAYKWGQMVLEPGCSATLAQRQAIGALCYDAGVSINMDYTAENSSAFTYKAGNVLQDTFQYGNAISSFNYDYSAEVWLNIGSGLEGMVNPNLDAGIPVIFGIKREGGGHAILADGYGYNSSTPYHHLNMGWSGGDDDAWYNLPNIDSTNYTYNVIHVCIYNIFTTGSGEIISGRVTDAYGSPISGATVTATGQGNNTHTDKTDSKGIYALAKVNSQSTYTLSVTKLGYSFPSQDVRTGKSENYGLVSGNRWGGNFKAGIPPRGSREDFETNNFRKFPWEHEGDGHWTTTSWEKHSGNYSAQAGSIDDYGRTTLRVRLDCISGNITFYRKVSSESLSDFLTFYIDGVEKDTWSGDEDWAKLSFHVATGTRTFEWTYSKDYSVAEGDDTAWIDDIAFPVLVEEPPTPPPPHLSVTPSEDLSSSGNPGGPFSPNSTAYTLRNTGGGSLSWRASKTKSWVGLSQINGALSAGQSTTVRVSINSNANNLAVGDYFDTVSFTNQANHSGDTIRSVSLHIAPDIIYVDDDADPGGDGTSWATAYKYLQDALVVANDAPKPVELRVAKGTYKPDRNSSHPDGNGDQRAMFQLTNGVTIRGGYAGIDQADPDIRNVNVYETTLSGDLNDNDGPQFSGMTENTYHVVNSPTGADLSAVIDGFIITGGNANKANPDDRGAGMYISFSSPTVSNCIFRENSATGSENSGGGGIYCESSNPKMKNCRFVSNRAVLGGGIHNLQGSSPQVINCTFTENRSDYGGGIYNRENSNPTLENCTFTGNLAHKFGGGMRNVYDSNPRITNCIFSDNVAESLSGGGIANRDNSSPTVLNCTFIWNRANNGGGMYNDSDSSPTLSNCILWGNRDSSGISEPAQIHGGTVTVNYSCIQALTGALGGIGNIDTDPLFVNPGNDDYHLKSQAGRWDPNTQTWVIDDITSPCIDAGDPGTPVGLEPPPNGGIINMGAFGGTPQASISFQSN